VGSASPAHYQVGFLDSVFSLQNSEHRTEETIGVRKALPISKAPGAPPHLAFAGRTHVHLSGPSCRRIGAAPKPHTQRHHPHWCGPKTSHTAPPPARPPCSNAHVVPQPHLQWAGSAGWGGRGCGGVLWGAAVAAAQPISRCALARAFAACVHVLVCCVCVRVCVCARMRVCMLLCPIHMHAYICVHVCACARVRVCT